MFGLLQDVLEVPISVIKNTADVVLPEKSTLKDLVNAGLTVADLAISTGLSVDVIESILDSD